MSVRKPKAILDAFFRAQYLRLNEAIEQLTADMVAHDPRVFRSSAGNIRYVAERQLFFALFANKELFDYFVASRTGAPLPEENSLSVWTRAVAPYFRGDRPNFAALSLRTRFFRRLYRRRGDPLVEAEALGGRRPRVLFHIIHPKFVRYLMPIAERLSVPYAFLVIEDRSMFDELVAQGLPRVHIDLSAESLAMAQSQVEILGRKFSPGFFDSWFIRLNAVRRALKTLAPDCIVVPEGNAGIYELVNQCAKKIGIPTVCVQQGWAPIVHPGFRNMSYGKMCVWGDEFMKMLAPFNPEQHFVATGNHVIDFREQGDMRERGAIAFFLQNGVHWLSDESWESLLDYIVWSAIRFPDREIRIREHPGVPLPQREIERLTTAKNVRLMPPGQFSLKQVLSGCRVSVAINSTTILEAIASGVVPLILDVGGFGGYYPDVAGKGAGIEVGDFAAARTALEQLVGDNGYCASFSGALDRERRALFARDAGEALDALVREIEKPAVGTRAWSCSGLP
jgi:hypothetical protein